MATRLFWHNALFDTATFPGSYPINQFGGAAPTIQAHLTPLNYNLVDATSVHRSMDIQKGTSQVTKTMTSLANVASQTYYWTKFISPPLTGVSSISANTWQLVYAFAESSLSANFIGPIIYVYVWRPSNGTRIGWINDQVNPADITEPGAINSERLKKTTFAGLAVSSVVNGDVIIWELCSRLTQAASGAYQDSFYFDGTDEYTAGSTGNVVTDMASYIETPQNLTFQSATIDATSDYKDIRKPITVAKI
jgi:hypothetical protein